MMESLQAMLVCMHSGYSQTQACKGIVMQAMVRGLCTSNAITQAGWRTFTVAANAICTSVKCATKTADCKMAVFQDGQCSTPALHANKTLGYRWCDSEALLGTGGTQSGIQEAYLDNELLCSHASNGDAALHHRSDDFHNGLVHSHGNKALQLQPLCYGSQCRVDLHIRMQVGKQTLVHSSRRSCKAQASSL